MSYRHKAREIALQILYRFDVQAQASGDPKPEGAALASEIQSHFEHFSVVDPIRDFASILVVGAISKQAELDARIESLASNWKVNRMGFVDRNLLRMALYELEHCRDIPRSVTIDEAVELAKQFGTSESPGFINGVLDALPASA